jgi:hypothetical protein
MDAPDPALPDQPPSDAEEWTDEQWLAWLEATDGDDAGTGNGAGGSAGGSPVTGRIVRSSGGQVLTSAMLGLAQAIYGQEENQVLVVAEGDSDPEEDQPFTVHLDPDDPEASYVVFRAPAQPDGEPDAGSAPG